MHKSITEIDSRDKICLVRIFSHRNFTKAMLPSLSLIYVWIFCTSAITANSKYVHLPIRRSNKTEDDKKAESTIKSTSTISGTKEKSLNVNIPKESNFYSIELSIGSSAQQVTLLLDTGSSDMVVVSNENSYCSTSMANDCQAFGTFDRSSSSSLQELNSQFSLKYGDGTFSTGDWVHDNIDLNGLDLDITFGLATNTDSMGVLGIGLKGLEVTSTTYNNFPLQLKENGIISKNSYSIYLESDKTQGDILFGAIDTSKIDYNNFYTFPMVNRYASKGYANPIRSEITMQGIGIQTSDGEQITISTTKLPALLDSGSTISYMPTTIVNSIIDTFSKHGISITSNGDTYGINCQYADDDSTMIVIDFGGMHINITLKQLVLDSSINGQCLFGITAQDTNTVIFGDTFFTSAYAVFNLDDYEVSLSQLNANGSDSKIENIDNSVPNAKQGDSYYSTWSADEGVQLGGNIFTLTNKNVQDASSTIFSSASMSKTISKYSETSLFSYNTRSSNGHFSSTSTTSSATNVGNTAGNTGSNSKTSKSKYVPSTITSSRASSTIKATYSSSINISHEKSDVSRSSELSSSTVSNGNKSHQTVVSSISSKRHSSTEQSQSKLQSSSLETDLLLSHSHKAQHITSRRSSTIISETNKTTRNETVSTTSQKEYNVTSWKKNSSSTDATDLNSGDSRATQSTQTLGGDATTSLLPIVIATTLPSTLPTTLVTDPLTSTGSSSRRASANGAVQMRRGALHSGFLLPFLALFV